MKKKILLLMGIFSIGISIHAQIGINTDTPLHLFHVDAESNSVYPDNTEDDVVMSSSGRMGIGTIFPSGRLTIESENNNNTGLQLLNGKEAGAILESDVTGNASWKEGKVQYQTMVEGTGAQITYNGAFTTDNAKQLTFFIPLFDTAKDIFGSAYGWDDLEQCYIAPVTGVYRIAYAAYFQAETIDMPGANPRAYLFKNKIVFQTSGIVSVTDSGKDVIGYTMGLTTLNKGDRIDLRVCVFNSTTGVVKVYGGAGHTFLMIESL